VISRLLVSLFSLGANAGGSRATLQLTSRLPADLTYLVADPADGLRDHFFTNPPSGRMPAVHLNQVRPKPHVRPGTATTARLLRRNLDLGNDLAWVRRQDRIAAGSGADLVCSMTTLMHRADVFFVHFLRCQAVEQTYGVSVSRADALLRRVDLKERHLLRLERTNLDPRNHRLLVVPSYRTAAALQFHYGVPSRRIAVVHNGVDDNTFAPPQPHCRREARARLGLHPDDVLVLFVGRSPERKGLEPLVASAARVLAEHDVEAFVPGEQSAHQLRHDWYAAADLLALPSMVEPFGLVALEAMASGVAPLVSDLSGAAEVISHGRTGLVVDGRRMSAALEETLTAALDGALDLRGLGAAGRIDVESRLSWSSQAARLQGRLDELAESGRSLVASPHAPVRPWPGRPPRFETGLPSLLTSPGLPSPRSATGQASATRSR
jgi:glycosyltransferase involved in cell wall biosynthesis